MQTSPTISQQSLKIVSGLAIVAFVICGMTIWLMGTYRQRQVDQATVLIEKRVAEIADDFRIRKDIPVQGDLADIDPWGEPIHLFRDDFLNSIQFVVCSNGPDRRHGTIDDLLGIESVSLKSKEAIARLEDFSEDDENSEINGLQADDFD